MRLTQHAHCGSQLYVLAAGGENLSELKAAFSQEERAIEHEIDHTVHTFSATIDVAYNVRFPPPAPFAFCILILCFAFGSSCRTEIQPVLKVSLCSLKIWHC